MYSTITKIGANLASGAASINAAIPTASSGQIPAKVRISATAPAAVKLGPAGVVAALGDAMVQPGDAITLAVPQGVTHFAAIQISAAGVVNIVPLEDA